ncbi:MAG TPA: hypothetical protein VMK12_13940 [Anaeromyxobacteraceae bacterium]|nr:hypothetical protein [Anaeromyxobacteraceae bacterium]
MALKPLVSVSPPADDQRTTVADVAPVVGTQVLGAEQIQAARRWIAEMALRWVRAESAGRDADDGA